MTEAIMSGLRYGITAACCIGSFTVSAAIITPIVVLAWCFVAKILTFGGNKDE